jgi:polar amino acid transport system substrate-binding protein
MVGFNRRFSKSFELINDFYRSRKDPMVISFRVNAGFIPSTFWLFTPENGGRIIGEGCHFIDCMVYLTKSLPVKVYAECVSSSNISAHNRDIAIATIKFADGSVGTLQYLPNGDSALPKEYCEVFCEGSTAIMNNYTSVELYRGGKVKKHNPDGRKGHKEEVIATINSIKSGSEMPISYREIRAITSATFAIEESLNTGNWINIE